MDAREVDVAWENIVVLDTVQALLGFVSPQLRGVSVELRGADVRLHFAVTDLDDGLEEDVKDIVGDLAASLWPETPDITEVVFVGAADLTWEGRKHRLVMLAKDLGGGSG